MAELNVHGKGDLDHAPRLRAVVESQSGNPVNHYAVLFRYVWAPRDGPHGREVKSMPGFRLPCVDYEHARPVAEAFNAGKAA